MMQIIFGATDATEIGQVAQDHIAQHQDGNRSWQAAKAGRRHRAGHRTPERKISRKAQAVASGF